MAQVRENHRPINPRPAEATRPLRFGPNVYIAQTQPGFEAIAWTEIAALYSSEEGARAPLARELARRSVPDRAGMCIFSAPRPDPLRALRTVEDIFAVVGYRHALGSELSLERVRAAAREAPFIDDAIVAHTRMLPGSRGGRRLRYRVVSRMTGDHQFRRSEFKRAVERGIEERGDHTWRLVDDDADLEFWATIFANELLLAVRLSDEHMRHRQYKIAHRPGSLRPSAAAALAWLSAPRPDDVLLDPFCGAGTILIERAHLGRYKLLIGSDRDSDALAAARENIGPRYKPIELHSWDALALPLPDGSVNKIATNLPWGIRHGSHGENRRLYPQMLAEFRRVLAPGGLVVMLTGESRLIGNLMIRGLFRPERIIHVSILGAPATVYVWRPA